MNSTYYPSKARYFLTFQTAYTKWLKMQGATAFPRAALAAFP